MTKLDDVLTDGIAMGIRDGDVIRIDVKKRRLDVELSAAKLGEVKGRQEAEAALPLGRHGE